MRSLLSVATQQGRREYQEDRFKHNVTEDGVLLAVFDGHGGEGTSEFCEKNLLTAFNAVADDPRFPTISDKIRGIFEHLNTATARNDDGSTASIVFIPSTLTRAYVGILGDSPVIIKTGKGEIVPGLPGVEPLIERLPVTSGEYWYSPEHNVRSNPSEVKRIQKAGGYVHNGYSFSGRGSFSSGGLQLSRALGDRDFADILSREPEVFEIPLGLGSFVLVGTDGLLDPGHASRTAASDVVKLIERYADAGQLVANATITKPTGDNVTAMLLRVAE